VFVCACVYKIPPQFVRGLAVFKLVQRQYLAFENRECVCRVFCVCMLCVVCALWVCFVCVCVCVL